MPNYSAFNVDPLRYTQAGMGNALNAFALRDRRNQNVAADALASRRLDQQDRQLGQADRRIAQDDRRMDISDQDLEVKRYTAALNYTLKTAKSPDEAKKIYDGFADKWNLDKNAVSNFYNVGDDQAFDMPTEQGILSIKGKPQAMDMFTVAVNKKPSVLKDQQALMRLAAETGVSIDLTPAKKEKYTPSYKTYKDSTGKTHTIDVNSKAPQEDWVPYKDDGKSIDASGIIDQNIDNALNQHGYRKAKGGGYEKVAEDQLGQPTYVPVTGEEAQWAAETERNQRAYTKAVLKYMKANNIDDYDEAAYEFEIEREKYRRSKADDPRKSKSSQRAQRENKTPMATESQKRTSKDDSFLEAVNTGKWGKAYNLFREWDRKKAEEMMRSQNQ